MEGRQHTYLSKFTDFPLYVYIIGLFLLSFGITAQICVEIKSGLWNNPPPYWERLKFIHPGFSSYDTQKKLQEIFGAKPPNLPMVKQEDFYKIAGEDFPSRWPEWLKKKGIRQRMSWAARIDETALDYEISQKRLALLEKALYDKANPFFLSSREKYEEEKRINEALKTKTEKLNIGVAKKGFVGEIINYFLVLGIFLTASWCLPRLAKSHISPEVVLADWKLPYWSFFLILYLCQTCVVCYTSILKEEKFWIGASSFFVSWGAWCLERVAIFGLSMIVAIPTTQLWCYLRKKLIPEISPVWLRRPVADFAVGKYVIFLQTWTLIIFGSFSIITIGTVRWAASQQVQFEKAYLLDTIVGVGLAALMVGKMIRNAIELRSRYQDSLFKHFDSWNAIRDANVPTDPTRDFIGESWWKLPANFVGIITATWAVLEFMGVAKVIVDALK
jgi:hypothetical protein